MKNRIQSFSKFTKLNESIYDAEIPRYKKSFFGGAKTVPPKKNINEVGFVVFSTLDYFSSVQTIF